MRMPATGAALLAGALLFAQPATAQQAVLSDRQAAQRPLMLQAPALDFRSAPAISPRSTVGPRQESECAPAWPCRLRLFGVIDRTGGVGLKGPVLTW
jgi:hypothetical protein